MSNAVLFFTESHLHDPNAQQKEVDQWLQSNKVEIKKSVVETVRGIGDAIERLKEDPSLQIFVCSDISAMGKCSLSIIRNFLKLEHAGIKVVVANSIGLNDVNEFCPLLETECPHTRNSITSIFESINRFEQKKRSKSTKRGMGQSKSKKHIGRPSKITEDNKRVCEELQSEGQTLKEISEKTGLAINTVIKALNHKD